MEPENRRYVDAGTKPGDTGTEEWSDTPPGSGDPVRRGPLAEPVEPTDGGVVGGSPADKFIGVPDSISVRNDEDDPA